MNSMIFSLPLLFFLLSCEAPPVNAIEEIESQPIPVKDTLSIDRITVLDSANTPLTAFPFEEFNITLDDSVSYDKRKLQAEALRVKLARSYYANEIDLDSVTRAFENFLVQNIFPHWYGTLWDYEGHTNVPNVGEVACGYFVSTTLRHMNVQLNRYHLAQQASSNGAKSLAVNFNNITTYRNIADFENKLDEGLYTVGLSNHVGFLLKRNNTLFFIHSDYIEMEVKPELAANSEALNYSTIFVIVRVGNKDLMRKWLNKETVKIYRQ